MRANARSAPFFEGAGLGWVRSVALSGRDAFRIGDDYGIDRDAVLKLRTDSPGHPIPFVTGPNAMVGSGTYSSTLFVSEGALAHGEGQ